MEFLIVDMPEVFTYVMLAQQFCAV